MSVQSQVVSFIQKQRKTGLFFEKICMLQSTHKMANLTHNEICAVLCLKRQYKHDGEKMAM